MLSRGKNEKTPNLFAAFPMDPTIAAAHFHTFVYPPRCAKRNPPKAFALGRFLFVCVFIQSGKTSLYTARKIRVRFLSL